MEHKDRLTNEGNLVTECVTCHHKFTINAEEIRFYRGRGLNLPTHCSVCRRLKRAKHGDNGTGMLNIMPEINLFNG